MVDFANFGGTATEDENFETASVPMPEYGSEYGYPPGHEGEVPGCTFPKGMTVSYVNGTDSLGLPGPGDAASDEGDVDDVWEGIIDNEEEEKAYRATKPPPGTYLVLNGLRATKSKRETEYVEPTAEGYAVVRKPRPSIRYSGNGSKETEFGTITPRVGFNMSPIKGYKRKFETKEVITPYVYDRDHEMYQVARRAYVEYFGLAKGAKFKGSDVDLFLQTVPLELRCMAGSTDLIVLGIKGIKGS